MKIKEFKEKEIPKFNFEVVQQGMVLVQVFFSKPESSIILTEEVKKAGTEIRNVFKVLSDTDKFKAGDLVSLQDHLVEPPIIAMKPSKGNVPGEPERPVFGRPCQAIESYSFDCSKTMEEDYQLEFVYLIPQEFITIKYR